MKSDNANQIKKAIKGHRNKGFDAFSGVVIPPQQSKPNNTMSAAKNWFESFKDDPKKIIAWAKREIRAYEELIKLVENAKN